MASASSLQISISIRCSSSTTHNNRLFPGGFSNLRPTFSLPQSSLPRSVLTCARRRSTKSSSPVPSSKKKKKNVSSKDVEVLGEEDLDDDAFEALFQQLAEDLKNDDLSLDDDDEEITDEELAKLEAELDEVLNDGELMGLFNSMVDDATEKEVKGNVEEEDEEEDELVEEDEEEDELVEEDEEEDELEEDDEEEDDSEVEETQVELRRWQLKRLAYALKLGRRKANIKTLAADLCLDRAVVLQLLRDPPPDLLMLSATLPDEEEPEPTILEPETGPSETTSPVKRKSKKLEAKKKVPIHELRSGWSAQKGIKKVHAETLERVYQRTKRPTGAMVSNIVHVTGIPRKTVVKWFEDRRSKDDVPDHRKPYERSATEPGVFTSS